MRNKIIMVQKLKKTILGIAIALVLVFFWGYSVATVYSEPDSNEYCTDIDFRLEVDSCDGYEPIVRGNRGRYAEKILGDECYCDERNREGELRCSTPNPEYADCMQEYYDIREDHNRVSFIILIILGLVSIFAGFKLKIDSVSSGVMGGGVLTLIYAAMRYWGTIQDYGRLIILGVALLVLVWIGYKKFK